MSLADADSRSHCVVRDGYCPPGASRSRIRGSMVCTSASPMRFGRLAALRVSCWEQSRTRWGCQLLARLSFGHGQARPHCAMQSGDIMQEDGIAASSSSIQADQETSRVNFVSARLGVWRRCILWTCGVVDSLHVTTYLCRGQIQYLTIDKMLRVLDLVK